MKIIPMKTIAILAAVCVFSACASADKNAANQKQVPASTTNEAKLQTILNAQEPAVKARYSARHPYETLTFMDIKPGMTVVELLPGDGWYTKILLPYLGKTGTLVGMDYALTMWPNFPFGTAEFINERRTWPQKWSADAKGWAGEGGAAVQAYTLNTVPESLYGKVDRVMYIRAMHNLVRFEKDGKFLTDALLQTHKMLKSGGLVGIVQHQAAESKTDAWADGSTGYVKKSRVIKAMTDAGFELVAESDLNTNPKDQPGDTDTVWRLAPSFYTSQENTEQRTKYQAIGESNRMTLLFRKP